ncbi:hydrolase [Agrobacterium rhizogenes]|jgi:calcineurin-like phosphoesterase family protein|nr:hydrolase [Rhizobium rhizogenes]NTH62200.1 hydrolase [Rhizobium rhizogenes]NTH93826.1 hydrolase [Rhizobium rhizogenes]
MIYFTSDTHFGDSRVLRIDNRPFPDMTDHDVTLIRYWNETVEPDDEVWHLGDLMSSRAGDPDQLLSMLNGKKHLIIGNNDPPAVTEARGWSSTQHYSELTIDDQLLILCHYPFRTWNKMGKKAINLHGHSHGKLAPFPRQYDVGVDVRGLRPVRLAEILASRGRAAPTG